MLDHPHPYFLPCYTSIVCLAAHSLSNDSVLKLKFTHLNGAKAAKNLLKRSLISSTVALIILDMEEQEEEGKLKKPSQNYLTA